MTVALALALALPCEHLTAQSAPEIRRPFSPP